MPATTFVALNAVWVLGAPLVVLVAAGLGGASLGGPLVGGFEGKGLCHELLEGQLSHEGTEVPAEVHRFHFLHIPLFDHGLTHDRISSSSQLYILVVEGLQVVAKLQLLQTEDGSSPLPLIMLGKALLQVLISPGLQVVSQALQPSSSTSYQRANEVITPVVPIDTVGTHIPLQKRQVTSDIPPSIKPGHR